MTFDRKTFTSFLDKSQPLKNISNLTHQSSYLPETEKTSQDLFLLMKKFYWTSKEQILRAA